METTSMQNLGGQTKSIMVFLKVAYDKDSKCKLKKCLFGNKTKESKAPRILLLDDYY